MRNEPLHKQHPLSEDNHERCYYMYKLALFMRLYGIYDMSSDVL